MPLHSADGLPAYEEKALTDGEQFQRQYDAKIQRLRESEYPALKGKTYLDHGGTTLYAKSLIETASRDLVDNLYGNPHSASIPSVLSSERVEEVRERTLKFFKADPKEFDLVFVPNATAAIRTVMECFRDYSSKKSTLEQPCRFWYGFHKDAHTSLVGIREATEGSHRCFASDADVEDWISRDSCSFDSSAETSDVGLFAYPGQSNMTGRRLPLTWPAKVRQTRVKHPVFTLLDAAALATTSPLDFSNHLAAPDFTSVSFYKIFGYPDLGALIVRKRSSEVLKHRQYFGGGTVEMVVTVGDSWHQLRGDHLHERLEDGTLPFHSIFALGHALDVHESLYGGMSKISSHTAWLGKHMYTQLSSLSHPNGAPLCKIYTDSTSTYGDPRTQGATIAMNVYRADGTVVSYTEVERLANSYNIFIRSGSLCNPGGIATYLDWTPEDYRTAFAMGHRCSNPTELVMGKLTGVVRVSMGAMSTYADVEAFVRFLQESYILVEKENQTMQVEHMEKRKNSVGLEQIVLEEKVGEKGRLTVKAAPADGNGKGKRGWKASFSKAVARR